MGFWRFVDDWRSGVELIFDRLSGRKPNPMMIDEHTTVEEYPKVLDNEWDRYLKWRDAQVCVNCQAPFSTDKPNGWVTETQCADCYLKHGPGGKRRADYLDETGNRYL